MKKELSRTVGSMCRLHLKSVVKGCVGLFVLLTLTLVGYNSFKLANSEGGEGEVIDSGSLERSLVRPVKAVPSGHGVLSSGVARGEVARGKMPSSEHAQRQLDSPRNPDSISPVRREDISNILNKLSDGRNKEHLLNLVDQKQLQKPLNDAKSAVKNRYKSLRHRFPRIMIIGFGKTGTRALFDTLKMHPALRGPTAEKRFFSDHFEKGLVSYLKSLPDPPANGFVIEKSPDYIIDYQTPARIITSVEKLAIEPRRLKFIVMLRDPIDRAMSEYLEWKIARQAAHKPKLPPFDAMVMHSNGSVNEDQPFLKASNYQKHIKHWFKFFGQKQACFVDGEKFIKDPYSEVHLLESCLSLPPHFTPKHFVFDSKKGFYCFKSSVDEKDAHCMNASKGREHPNISTLVFGLLKKYYQPFDDQLYRLTGRLMLWQKLSN